MCPQIMLYVSLVSKQLYWKCNTNVHHDGRTRPHHEYVRSLLMPQGITYISKQRPVTAHLLTSTLTYVELQLGCCLRQLAVEGEKGEDGDEVGGELVLLQPLLDWVKKWGWENLE